MNGELLRLVETIHRQKDIDKELIFQGIEAAVASATKKHYGRDVDIVVELDRETGELRAFEEGEPLDPEELGRIAAQSAKQMMIQKIREAERDVVYSEFEDRIGSLVIGSVQRYEGGSLIVNIDGTECLIIKRDLVPGDSYRPGDTLRAVISAVKKSGQRVKIHLARASNDFIIRLFELEVPEINEGLVEVKAIARIPGYRTKVAIKSNDSRIDSVGACVGVRGSRIRNVVGELNGEKIDIIEWNDSPEILIVNSLKPAEISGLELDDESESAKVIVNQDQLSLAIGKRGQNVKLATKLTGWNLEIVSEEQDLADHDALIDRLIGGGLEEKVAHIIVDAGYSSVSDVLERGSEALAMLEGIDEESIAAIMEKLSSIPEAEPMKSKTIDTASDVSDAEKPRDGEEIPTEDLPQPDEASQQPGKDES